jgi:uncharacterized protein YprB with RNaseH-like and TPR domain
MASDLRARLRAIGGGTPRPAPSSGLVVRVHEEDAAPRLFHLEQAALTRMGFQGEWPGAHRALFLDTETTGLSGGAGTVAFMIGFGFLDGGRFKVEQYMMRSYSDEPLLIAKASEMLARFDAVVTFNGDSFDLPLMESRFTMCRMRQDWRALAPLDLMRPARRLWKRRLGSCRLGVLEDQILRRGRVDDLPGSEAPRRFFEAMRTGNFEPLEKVFDHNRLDVAALSQLLCALGEAYGEPGLLTDAADLYSMGRVLERRGEDEGARRCYVAAATPKPLSTIAALRGEKYQAEANRAFSVMLKRAGEWPRAERVWLEMLKRRQLGAWPLIELAKYYEHRAGRLYDALQMTEIALAVADPETGEALSRRRQRLLRKLEGNG